MAYNYKTQFNVFLSAYKPKERVRIVATRILEQVATLQRKPEIIEDDHYQNLIFDVTEARMIVVHDRPLWSTDEGKYITEAYTLIVGPNQQAIAKGEWSTILRAMNGLAPITTLREHFIKNIGPNTWWRYGAVSEEVLLEIYGAHDRKPRPIWNTIQEARAPTIRSQPYHNVKVNLPKRGGLQYKALRSDHPLNPVRCENCIQKDLVCLMPVDFLSVCINCGANKLRCSNSGMMIALPEAWWTRARLTDEDTDDAKLRLEHFDHQERPCKPYSSWDWTKVDNPDIEDPGYSTEYGTGPNGFPACAKLGDRWYVKPSYEPGRKQPFDVTKIPRKPRKNRKVKQTSEHDKPNFQTTNVPMLETEPYSLPDLSSADHVTLAEDDNGPISLRGQNYLGKGIPSEDQIDSSDLSYLALNEGVSQMRDTCGYVVQLRGLVADLYDSLQSISQQHDV